MSTSTFVVPKPPAGLVNRTLTSVISNNVLATAGFNKKPNVLNVTYNSNNDVLEVTKRKSCSSIDYTDGLEHFTDIETMTFVDTDNIIKSVYEEMYVNRGLAWPINAQTGEYDYSVDIKENTLVENSTVIVRTHSKKIEGATAIVQMPLNTYQIFVRDNVSEIALVKEILTQARVEIKNESGKITYLSNILCSPENIDKAIALVKRIVTNDKHKEKLVWLS